MIQDILNQINKPITVKLDPDNRHNNLIQLELKDFVIDFFLEASITLTKPESSTIEHFYQGGDVDSFHTEIHYLFVYDHEGNEIRLSKVDLEKITKAVESKIHIL